MQAPRAVTIGVAGTLAYLALAAWGVVNLVEGDWFIGAVFTGCAAVGLPALLSAVRRMRRREQRSQRDRGARR